MLRQYATPRTRRYMRLIGRFQPLLGRGAPDRQAAWTLCFIQKRVSPAGKRTSVSFPREKVTLRISRHLVAEQLALIEKHLKPPALTMISDRGTFSAGHLLRLQEVDRHRGADAKCRRVVREVQTTVLLGIGEPRIEDAIGGPSGVFEIVPQGGGTGILVDAHLDALLHNPANLPEKCGRRRSDERAKNHHRGHCLTRKT